MATALILLALSLAPGAAIIAFIYLQDKHEKEPIKLLVVSFLLGCVSVVPAILLESLGAELGLDALGGIIGTAIHAIIVVALAEEFSKYIFLNYYAYPKKDFNEPFDGIVYAVMIGMGFATVENVMYVFNQGSFGEGVTVGVMRMLLSVPAHATFAVIMGYYVGKAKFSTGINAFNLKMTGLMLAVLLHGAFDFFLFLNWIPGIWLGSIISFLIAIRFSFKAIRKHQDDSPFRNFKHKFDKWKFPNF